MSKFFIIAKSSEATEAYMSSGCTDGVTAISEMSDLLASLKICAFHNTGIDNILIITNPKVKSIPDLRVERRDMKITFTTKQVRVMSQEMLRELMLAGEQLMLVDKLGEKLTHQINNLPATAD